jgi:hypothetical protein
VAKYIVMEEFHLTITAAVNQPQHIFAAMARALRSPRLQTALRRAIREVFRREPALRAARFRITR